MALLGVMFLCVRFFLKPLTFVSKLKNGLNIQVSGPILRGTSWKVHAIACEVRLALAQ
jgi:hypothetical protein